MAKRVFLQKHRMKMDGWWPSGKTCFLWVNCGVIPWFFSIIKHSGKLFGFENVLFGLGMGCQTGTVLTGLLYHKN